MTLAAKFIVEEDAEAMQKELREAFRLYDKEGENHNLNNIPRKDMKKWDDVLKSYHYSYILTHYCPIAITIPAMLYHLTFTDISVYNG